MESNIADVVGLLPGLPLLVVAGMVCGAVAAFHWHRVAVQLRPPISTHSIGSDSSAANAALRSAARWTSLTLGLTSLGMLLDWVMQLL
jgi:hypothetical protein